jgi:undecaprenyl diphosphate synthase
MMALLPAHLAIIMDGNGRWARSRGHNRFFGHVRGAKVAKKVIEECRRLGVKNLTLFTFSSENWERPPAEVAFLMKLLTRRLRRERPSLIKNNIRFRCIGDFSKLPDSVRAEVDKTVEETKNCTGMNLVFALSYGGRQEIVAAARDLAQQVASGKIKAEDIDEELFARGLSSSFLPDPDLIIRTSGESRLSNFYLWQSAYSELFISPKMWPEFDESDLKEAMACFNTKERRFGKTSDQVRVLASVAEEGV